MSGVYWFSHSTYPVRVAGELARLRAGLNPILPAFFRAPNQATLHVAQNAVAPLAFGAPRSPLTNPALLRNCTYIQVFSQEKCHISLGSPSGLCEGMSQRTQILVPLQEGLGFQFLTPGVDNMGPLRNDAPAGFQGPALLDKGFNAPKEGWVCL